MAPKMKHSKRKSLRFKLPNKKITYMAKGHLGRATLQNISTSGCFITNNTTELERDDQILIVIELTECDKPLELKAIVVRVGDKDFSVKFTDIDESFITDFSTMLAIERRNSLSN
jgi:hypothetical protein